MNPMLQAQWDIFRTTVVPHDASPAQVQEMRRAFFAGAASFFDLTMRFTGPEYSEDDGVAAMDCLQAELLAFANEVKAGKR